MLREFLTIKKNIVGRPRLDQLLFSAMEYPLTALIAGPGYGKTIAVSEFARKTKRRLVWVNLLPLDNDADRFWQNFTEAARAELPTLAAELETINLPNSLGEFDAFVRLISRELFAGVEGLLVLNDIDCIENESILRFFNQLFRVEPENLCVIVTANERLDPRLMAKANRYTQLGAPELQFNEEETLELFHLYGHEIDGGEARRILEHTGGWPLALHLIASRPDYVTHPPLGEARHLQVIAEIFETGYYSGFDDDIQVLLIKLSFFQKITLGLTQALGAADAARVLDALSRNIFLSYDHLSQRFYIQAMYRSYLASKQGLLTEREVESLFTRAGQWYMANGDHYEALDCFERIGDHDACVSVIERMPMKNRSSESASTILSLLNEMPLSYIQTHGVVDYYRAVLCLKVQRVCAAQELFAKLIAEMEQGPLDDDGRAVLGDAYIGLVIASLAQGQGGAVPHARRALELLRPGNRIRSIEISQIGNNEVFFLPAAGPGLLDDTFAYIDELMGCLNALEFAPHAHQAFAHLFAAEGCFHAGRHADATRQSIVAIQYAQKQQQHDIAANAMLLQMRQALYAGNAEQAEATLQELSGYVEQNDPVRLLQLKDCAQGMFYLHMGVVNRAPYWLLGEERRSGVPLDLGRDKVISALCQYAAGEYFRAYTTAIDLESVFSERNSWGLRLITHILKAACLLQFESEEKAVEEFHKAYAMTWQNGMLTAFVEFGRVALELLDAARKQGAYAFDADWLARVAEQTQEYIIRESAMVKRYRGEHHGAKANAIKLTPREKEILQYLAEGLTREEIRAVLGISINGVKKHITNIYNKLGAINRADAIHIAIANGIITMREPV